MSERNDESISTVKDKFRIEIVHLHWMSLSFFCVLSKLILKIPFLTTTHLINKSTPSFTRFYSNYNIIIKILFYPKYRNLFLEKSIPLVFSA